MTRDRCEERQGQKGASAAADKATPVVSYREGGGGECAK